MQVGSLPFLSALAPRRPDGTRLAGKVGDTLAVRQGYEAARLAGPSRLARIRAQPGSLDRVKHVVKVPGMVNALGEREAREV